MSHRQSNSAETSPSILITHPHSISHVVSNTMGFNPLMTSTPKVPAPDQERNEASDTCTIVTTKEHKAKTLVTKQAPQSEAFQTVKGIWRDSKMAKGKRTRRHGRKGTNEHIKVCHSKGRKKATPARQETENLAPTTKTVVGRFSGKQVSKVKGTVSERALKQTRINQQHIQKDQQSTQTNQLTCSKKGRWNQLKCANALSTTSESTEWNKLQEFDVRLLVTVKPLSNGHHHIVCCRESVLSLKFTHY